MEKMILVTLLVIGYSTIIIKLFWSFGSKNQKNQCQKYRKIKLLLVFIVVLITSSSAALLNYSLNQNNIENEMDELDNVIKDFDQHAITIIAGLDGNPRIEDFSKIIHNINDTVNQWAKDGGLDQLGNIEKVFEEYKEYDEELQKLVWSLKSCPLNNQSLDDGVNSVRQIGPYLNRFDDLLEINEYNFRLIPGLMKVLYGTHVRTIRKYEHRIGEHLKQTIRFFEKFRRVLTEIRGDFRARKMELTKKQIFYTNIFLIPLGFSIIFGISICFTVLFNNRVTSIISTILFYILILQIITVSLLSMYNQSTVRLKLKEHERFLKIFDIKISSYNEKDVLNAYYTMIFDCKRESKMFFSDFKHGLLIHDYSQFDLLHHDLIWFYEIVRRNMKMPTFETINSTVSHMEIVVKTLNNTFNCTQELSAKRDSYQSWLENIKNHTVLWFDIIEHFSNSPKYHEALVINSLAPLKKNVYVPIQRINETLGSSSFECSGIYKSLINAHVSSYQPYPDIYRTRFKITVVFGGTLLLILYLWSTIEYETQSAENSNSPDVPRSPKRD